MGFDDLEFDLAKKKHLSSVTRNGDMQHNGGCSVDNQTNRSHNGGSSVDNQTNSSDCGLIDLEQLLKQKTFTMAEFNRLEELLRSRTIESSNRNHENSGDKKGKSVVLASDDLPRSSKIPMTEASSPAEVAKAYMGSRPNNDFSLSGSFRDQAFSEETFPCYSRLERYLGMIILLQFHLSGSHMGNRRAPKSTEDIRSSNLLSRHEVGKAAIATSQQNAVIAASMSQYMDEESKLSQNHAYNGMGVKAPQATGVSKITLPSKNVTKPPTTIQKNPAPSSVSIPISKTPAFRISVPEDSFDLDDDEDDNTNRLSVPSTSTLDSTTKISAQNATCSKTSSENLISSSEFSKKEEKDASDPYTHSLLPPTPSTPTPQFNIQVSQKETEQNPIPSLGSKDVKPSINDIGVNVGGELRPETTLTTSNNATTNSANESTMVKSEAPKTENTPKSPSLASEPSTTSVPLLFSLRTPATSTPSNGSLNPPPNNDPLPSNSITRNSTPANSVSNISSVSSAAAMFSTTAPIPSFQQSDTEPKSFNFSTLSAVLPTSSITFGAIDNDNDKPANNVSSTFGTQSTQSSAGQFSLFSCSPLFGSNNSAFGFSTSSSTTPFTFTIFGSSSQASSSSSSAPVCGSSVSGSSPFKFGSSTPGYGLGFMFGSSAPGSTSAPSTFNLSSISTPLFGAQQSTFGIGANSPSNDQMSMEGSLTDATNQASSLTFHAFGQPQNSTAPGFMFGSPAPTFSCCGVQNPPVQQQPFQPGGLVDFNLGGSFSLGSRVGGGGFKLGGSFSFGSGGGVVKSTRKIVKVKRGLRGRK